LLFLVFFMPIFCTTKVVLKDIYKVRKPTSWIYKKGTGSLTRHKHPCPQKQTYNQAEIELGWIRNLIGNKVPNLTKMQKKNRKQTSIVERLPAHKTRMRTCCIKSDIKETTTFNMHNQKTKQRDNKSFQLAEKTKHLKHISHIAETWQLA